MFSNNYNRSAQENGPSDTPSRFGFSSCCWTATVKKNHLASECRSKLQLSPRFALADSSRKDMKVNKQKTADRQQKPYRRQQPIKLNHLQ